MFCTQVQIHLKIADLLKRYQPSGLEIHDFEIAAIALTHHISHIVTFNKKDFEKIKEIKPLRPDEVSKPGKVDQNVDHN